MNSKVLILAAVLSAHAAWANSSEGDRHSNSSLPPSQNQSPTRLTATEQRRLLHSCLDEAELARNRAAGLLRNATQGWVTRDELQQHFSEVRSAVDSMSEYHRRFLYTLTEEQWTAAKDPITRLEQFRASIQAQLEGIDLELQMPAPDSQHLIRYVKRMRALLQDWRKQYRKMSATASINL